MTRLRAWWSRNVVADDPAPEYSRLDRLDGLPSRYDAQVTS